MTNSARYLQVFVETFGIGEEEVKKLAYHSIPAWDSIGHMQLVAAIEDAFDIMMDTEDIIDLNSYEKGKEILRKYDVEIE